MKLKILQLFSNSSLFIIIKLNFFPTIYKLKTEKGDELAGIGLVRLHDEISWYEVVIYASTLWNI